MSWFRKIIFLTYLTSCTFDVIDAKIHLFLEPSSDGILKEHKKCFPTVCNMTPGQNRAIKIFPQP